MRHFVFDKKHPLLVFAEILCTVWLRNCRMISLRRLYCDVLQEAVYLAGYMGIAISYPSIVVKNRHLLHCVEEFLRFKHYKALRALVGLLTIIPCIQIKPQHLLEVFVVNLLAAFVSIFDSTRRL